MLGARYYWPELGPFISQDPIGDGVNWYAYVRNNPVVRVDPEGLWAQEDHGELADCASAGTGLNEAAREALHAGAEGPDEPFWAIVLAGMHPHFGEDLSEAYLDKAVGLWNEGKRNKAMDTLGWGLHNLADVLVHPEDPGDHPVKRWGITFQKGDPSFSEDRNIRRREWAEAQRRSRNLVERFVARTQ